MINLLKIFKKETLRDKGIRYVKEHFGEEFVNEFCDNYDILSEGGSIGGFEETAVYLHLIETIRKWEG